ncbi:MAG: hypothetical protein EOP56_04150 [Sphingobacteriales bacterium]|nr:MAG: hypothetical protein EOP56_04150 [Sphingobacteriales bacterium]
MLKAEKRQLFLTDHCLSLQIAVNLSPTLIFGSVFVLTFLQRLRNNILAGTLNNLKNARL